MDGQEPRVICASGAERAGPMWAVAAYFNAARYRSRLANYRLFRFRLRLPLLTMALEYHAAPELGDGDAEILVRLTEGAVLWQKERLYNEALKYLPGSCRKVVFLDADLVFPEADWTEKVDRALDRWPAIQTFSRLKHCSRPLEESALQTPVGDPDEWSAASLRSNGLSVSNAREATCAAGAPPRYIQGVSWGFRRDVIEQCGFFDSAIIGSGDSALWSALTGDHEVFLRKPRTPGVEDAWRAWRGRAFDACQGEVGYADSWVLSLWHGRHENRRYPDRWDIVRRHHFDPRTDIRVGEQGAWLWNGDNAQLQDDVRRYFLQREEDEELQPAEKPA